MTVLEKPVRQPVNTVGACVLSQGYRDHLQEKCKRALSCITCNMLWMESAPEASLSRKDETNLFKCLKHLFLRTFVYCLI